MKPRYLVAVAAISALTSFAQTSDNNQGPAVLSFEDAVNQALRTNIAFKQQQNLLLVQQAQKNQSIAAFLPSIAINGNGQRYSGRQPLPDGGDLADLTENSVNAQIGAQVTVFNGFNQVNRLQQNVSLFKAQSALVGRTSQDVIYNVTVAYLQVLLDQELLRIANENHDAQATLLEQISEQVRLGLKAEADRYSVDAQVRNLESMALRAKVTLNNDKSLLAQIIQMDVEQDFQVTFPKISGGNIEWQAPSLDSLYAIGFANREDLRALEYEVDADRHTYAASSNGYYPTVSLFANYGSQYRSSLKDNPLYGGFNNQFTNAWPGTTVGVSLNIPLFDRLQTRSTRVTNRVTYENAELRLQNLKKTVKIEVLSAYNNYHTAIQSYQASESQFKSGDLALRTQQESYRLGISDQVALALANQIYVQGAASKAQAEVTLIFQQILLNYALGTLRQEDVQ